MLTTNAKIAFIITSVSNPPTAVIACPRRKELPYATTMISMALWRSEESASPRLILMPSARCGQLGAHHAAEELRWSLAPSKRVAQHFQQRRLDRPLQTQTG